MTDKDPYMSSVTKLQQFGTTSMHLFGANKPGIDDAVAGLFDQHGDGWCEVLVTVGRRDGQFVIGEMCVTRLDQSDTVPESTYQRRPK